MNKEELHKRVAEDLWASFGYDSPEEHAVFLIKLISDIYIKEFLNDLDSLAYRIYKDREYNIMKVQVLYSKYTEVLGKWEGKLKE